MSKALTNNEFIAKLNLLITKLGGTPTTNSLDDDKLDDMLSNDVFVAKLNEVITAMGGTPINTELERDTSDDMVSNSVFNGKMDEVINNASPGGGGGGGSSDFSIAEVTFRCSSGWYDIASCADVQVWGLMLINKEPSTEYSESMHLPVINGLTVINYTAFSHIDWEQEPTLTGSVTLGNDGFEITGDCEITIAGLTD